MIHGSKRKGLLASAGWLHLQIERAQRRSGRAGNERRRQGHCRRGIRLLAGDIRNLALSLKQTSGEQEDRKDSKLCGD